MQTIPDGRKISPSLVIFLIHGMQYGVASLGFQRIIAKTAGYDAWISVILGGIASIIGMWMIFKIIDISGKDLAETHRYIFGKSLGSLFNIVFMFYFILYIITILRTYIEVVQVWMFNDLNVFFFTLIYLILCIFIVYGGFRVVTGMMFFSVILPAYLWVVYGYAFPYTDFRHFLPLFDHSSKDIIVASYQMSQSYMGYELFLIYQPFVNDYKASKKWAYSGIILSFIMFFYTAVISFAYYSEEQLQKFKWASLTIWKIVHLPFVERFEYVGIANWCLIILPNVTLALWCGSRLLKQTLKISQRKGVILLSFLPLFIVPMFKTYEQVDRLNHLLGQSGFIVNYIYLPLLLILIWLVNKRKKRVEMNRDKEKPIK